MLKRKLGIVSLIQLRNIFAVFLITSTVLFFYLLKNNTTIILTTGEEVLYTMAFFIPMALVMYVSYNIYLSVFIKEEELTPFK